MMLDISHECCAVGRQFDGHGTDAVAMLVANMASAKGMTAPSTAATSKAQTDSCSQVAIEQAIAAAAASSVAAAAAAARTKLLSRRSKSLELPSRSVVLAKAVAAVPATSAAQLALPLQ